MGEHDEDPPTASSEEQHEPDMAWLQLPRSEPYTSPKPLIDLSEARLETPGEIEAIEAVAEPEPPRATVETPQVTAPTRVTKAPSSSKHPAVKGDTGKTPTAKREVVQRPAPSLPKETVQFLAVHAAEFAPPPEPDRRIVAQGDVGTSARSAVVFIPGTSVSMGEPFIKRRERPLGMRLTIYLAVACTIISALFGVTALSGSDPTTALRALFQTVGGGNSTSGEVAYTWYVAKAGDTVEGLASRFHVQAGGIFEINNMRADQELQLGQKYKIPTDPFYGKDYRPTEPAPKGNGSTTFGNDWWNSYAGTPLPGAFCSPSGPKPTDYQMVDPNPGAGWVRGYTWYHLGIDSAGPYGEPIVAAQRGMVIWAGWTDLGYGYSVVINHCNHVSTLYGHMAKVLVKAGDNVVAGQPVGLEGSTGWSTGPHLHFSLFWDNQYVDPLPYYNNSQANYLRPCGCYTPVK